MPSCLANGFIFSQGLIYRSLQVIYHPFPLQPEIERLQKVLCQTNAEKCGVYRHQLHTVLGAGMKRQPFCSKTNTKPSLHNE
jgi:hypothetical protein